MKNRLFHEILMARQRVYAVGRPTPLERIDVPVDAEVLIKREDASPIHSYKWRGAYNRMAQLNAGERAGGVVCASAGNHAQGVALAAKRLGVDARIYMPVATPRMKQVAVKRHGGNRVEVILHGDTYDDAAARAREDVAESKRIFVHPYDDWAVMGGQGTMADEIVMSAHASIDVAYLQIGGGGMAASVACWLRAYYPGIHIVGVEGIEQASMQAAVNAGKPVTLDYVDVFCDGTAVKRVGDLTYPLCAELIDEFITVTNEEVCAAIQTMWEASRRVPEPSGAMGLAGLLQQADRVKGKRVLTILCGANMDFGQLSLIARNAGIGAAKRRYYRMHIQERSGSLLDILETALEDVNIIEFQYGKVDEQRAFPVIGVEASGPELHLIEQRLNDTAIAFEDVTSQADIQFRMVHYEPALFHLPYFIILEFPERAGALRDFLRDARQTASIVYFNYSFSGEQVGRALLGFEFESEQKRAAFKKMLLDTGRLFKEIGGAVLERVL